MPHNMVATGLSRDLDGKATEKLYEMGVADAEKMTRDLSVGRRKK